jgi:phospholipid transport system substrate-binding protein
MTHSRDPIRINRRAFAILAPLVAIFLLLGGRDATATEEAQARAFIEKLADQAIGALTEPGVSREEREARARVLLNENFAVPTIAQWVLGRYWRSATPEERRQYLELFEDLIIVTYVDRFTRYSGEDLKVTRTVRAEDGGDVLVYSEISRGGGQPFEVTWRVRERDGGFKIVDVYVEGVSMGQTQRSEFASVIQNSGGKISGLLEEMRRRLARAG